MITIIEDLKDLKSHLYDWLERKNFVGHLHNKDVFLKPNMGYPKPAPFTTSTKIIRNVVEVLSELKTQKIIIGEGSTSHSTALENFEATGLINELRDFKVQFLDLNKQESETVELPNNVTHHLPRILNKVDIRISMPVIKFYNDDDGEFFLSNAIKNFFGLPPKEMYQKKAKSEKRDSLHNNLHRSVVEIYQAIEKFAPFDLYICDGTKVLEGEAAEGQTKQWKKIVISDNALEADLAVLKLLKKPLPRYLRLLT